MADFRSIRMLKHLQIRYQTARSLPAPYAYFYTLTLRPVAGDALQADLAITYPDRDDIDDDELIAEGYTRDDDFSWSGRLPRTWLQTVTDLARKTRLQPADEDALGEDDEFWEMVIETDTAKSQTGRPLQPDNWQYVVQELIQAAYEADGRERPFELTYLDLSNAQNEVELRLTASFAERSVNVVRNQNRRDQTKTLPWATLQRVLSEVYAHDYDTDEAQLKRPRRDGQWLNLGAEEWYEVSELPTLKKMFDGL